MFPWCANKETFDEEAEMFLNKLRNIFASATVFFGQKTGKHLLPQKYFRNIASSFAGALITGSLLKLKGLKLETLLS